MNELPDAWVWSTIGDLSIYIQRGKSPRYANHSALPVINQKCIRWTGLELQHLKYVHPEQIPNWDESRYIRPGDILLNSTGTGTVGRAYLVKEEDCLPPKVVDSHVTLIRPAPGIYPSYLFGWLRSPAVQAKIEEMCEGTTNQIELSRAAILDMPIPLAPAAEQKRIADQIDRLIARVQRCEQHLSQVPQLLRRFREEVLDIATTGRLTEDWRPADAPSWVDVRLADVAESFTYGSSAKSAKSGRVPVLRMGNIQNGRLDWGDLVFTSDEKEIEKYRLSSGDFLFNRTNSPELVGKTAVFRGEREAIFAGYIIRVRCVPELLPEYLNLCMCSRAGRDYCWAVKSDGVSQSNINAKKLAEFKFKMPSLKEQGEVVKRAQGLFAIADRVQESYAAARRDAARAIPLLLAKAFRGELVQQEPDDEPASALLHEIQSHKDLLAKSEQPNRKRRPITMKQSTAAVSESIQALPPRAYTFDELRSLVPADYELLKETIFGLLRNPASGLAQTFDASRREIVLLRVDQ